MSETGPFAIQSLPMFSQNGPCWWLRWCRGPVEAFAYHLLSWQLRSRAQAPFPPQPFAWFTASCGCTRLSLCNGLGLRRGKKRRGRDFLRCAYTPVRGLLVCTGCRIPRGCSIPHGHICSDLWSSIGVDKQWEDGRVEPQREVAQRELQPETPPQSARS